MPQRHRRHGVSSYLAILFALTSLSPAALLVAGEEAARPAPPSARWKSHWAFQPPTRPPLPAPRAAASARNEVDLFVLAALERAGIEPGPEAEAATLLRRVHLDLTGLPPSIEEVEAFLTRHDDSAYEEVVERLLASPHHGERWGRHWLDAARYADSDGYEKDKQRTVWFYRDWVIEALNRDLPYDRFIIEQVAGDLLPDASQATRVATGFLRNSMINEEGGIDPEQFRMEAMFDRMDAIGKSVLGLTIQCAQCHDHKFDPLKQEEYYRIFAFLNNAHEANMPVYAPEQERQRVELFGKLRGLEAEVKERHPDWAERLARWEEETGGNQPGWEVLRLEVQELSTGGQRYLSLPDGSLLAQGYAPTKHRVELTAKTGLTKVTAIRLELLLDPNLPLRGPGRSPIGTAALTEFEVHAGPGDGAAAPARLEIGSATSDCELEEAPLLGYFDDQSKRKRVTGPIAYALDGKDETAWSTDAGPGRRNRERKAVFVAKQPFEHASGALLKLFLTQNHGGWNSDDNQSHNLGRFRLSVTSASDPVADPLPARVRRILSTPRSERSRTEADEVFDYWITTVPEWADLRLRVEELWRAHPEPTSQLVLEDRETPRGTRILKRGDFLKPQEAVAPGTPAFLHPMPESAPPMRLGFARWLVDRKAPTTARAIVNRIWQAYFGSGLVSTPEDLGMQSEPPAHPELLDWLAVELMEQGWSLKALHRKIVLSATYRRSSHASPEDYAQDPYNRLLARGPRQRVEGEVVRDIVLCASGLLDATVGGPSVFPPLAEFLLQPPVSYGPKVWDFSGRSGRYRRGLYTFQYRSLPYPVLQAFDVPNGDFSCVRRSRSNTPLQALASLNEEVFLESAQALAARALECGAEDDAGRLKVVFLRCIGRPPAADEAQLLLQFLEAQRARVGRGELDARLLSGEAAPTQGAHTPGETPPSASGAEQLRERAAWTALARVVLNLDETITKE